jgi:hypothetical protein
VFGGQGTPAIREWARELNPTRALLADVVGDEEFDLAVPYGLVMELLIDSWLERETTPRAEPR